MNGARLTGLARKLLSRTGRNRKEGTPRMSTPRLSTTRRTAREKTDPSGYVNFQFQERRYTLLPDQSKVYRDWIVVETSRAVQVLSAFRSEGDRGGH
ncbi:MAG: hypothetical protein ACE5HD_03415 [Acidobacteriota bacterium]